eukprot:49883_1
MSQQFTPYNPNSLASYGSEASLSLGEFDENEQCLDGNSSQSSSYSRILHHCHLIPESHVNDATFTLSDDGSMFQESRSQNDDDSILTRKGYRKIGKTVINSQGELFHCTLPNQRRVVIKKVNKSMYARRLVQSDGYDIVKEATILYYLTVENTPTAQYMTQYIDLIESEHCFYLITEHEERSTNLKQFIRTAQRYIARGILRQKEYNKTIKYIFWQMFVLMRWLHADMHCCHLDLRLENIMLENVAFVMGRKGSMTVNSSISIKICGFGRSEVFKAMRDEKSDIFKCNKPYDAQYEQSLISNCYDARSADIWSLGSMLYHCYSGEPLLVGYSTLTSGKLKRYLLRTCIANPKMIDLLCKLLKPHKSNTLAMMDVLQHPCFKMYYQKYKNRIAEKARTQRLRLMNQKGMLQSLPYYNIEKKVSFV